MPGYVFVFCKSTLSLIDETAARLVALPAITATLSALQVRPSGSRAENRHSTRVSSGLYPGIERFSEDSVRSPIKDMLD